MARLISLAHLTVMDADPLALIEAGAAGGFDAIGLRIVPPFPTDAIVPVIGDLPLQRRIKARLSDTGLMILDVEAIWLHPDSDIAGLHPALDLAAELGARHVLTVGNDPDRGRLAGNLARLCAAAHQRGLRVMLEFIPYAQVTTLADAAALLAAVRPADAGLLVDALHLSRSGGRPADLAAYDPALFSYGHLCDAPAAVPGPDGLRPEARGNRLYPGEGGLPLDDFVAGFPPGTPMAVEAPSAARAALPPGQRARLVGDATRAVLRRHEGS
ncbi:TIM barrel protein [Roseomonas hellenica]|uniref:TIM barrel protein n=1 Tax=Plastoroseomonas hellenica TaxID=2687306 RepID=A0ABS5ES66_9PROT|nr:TIM barrel protein [Plastoroseomonas hellenica]MBR0663083.1 TIM barrel protein [Plastoroseomonas hellenica]